MKKSKDLKYLKDNKRLMRLNVFFSNWYVISVVCALIVFFLFFGLNYIFITFLKLLSMGNNNYSFDNVFSIDNAFNFSKVTQFGFFYILILVFIAVLVFRYIYLIRTSFKNLDVGQKGVSRWTTLKEVQEQYKEIPEKTYSYKGNGGVPVCRYQDKIYIDDTPVNNLIIGITRSGKGEMFVFPTIDIYSRAENKPSMVITDPKLELYCSSKETLEKRGYGVYVLNLIDPLKSMGYNPLQMIIDAYKKKDYSQAELLCSSFCYSIFNPNESDGDSQYWSNTSTAVLSALILAQIDDNLKADEKVNAQRLLNFTKKKSAFEKLSDEEQQTIRNSIHKDTVIDDLKYIPTEYEFVPTHENEKKINMYSIINTFSTLARIQVDEFGTTALDIYFSEKPDLDRAKLKYATAELSGKKTKGNIFSNTLSKLTVFTYEEIAKMTAESTLNLKEVGFGKKPVAIFLGIPDYDKSNHFIASVFIRQLYFILAKTATLKANGKCDREVIFLVDEFGNLPAIEGMANIITVCLGRNIRFNLIVQAYSQIENLYGKDAETIIGNCGNQIYILTDDKETAENFSELIGNETIVNVHRSGSKMQLNKQYMEMYEEKPLLNKNELMELYEGECVVKRVMKRRDLKNRPVKPTPIFNTGETKFKYRYQYMLDDFPNRAFENIKDLPNRKGIDLTQRTFDVNKYFADKKRVEDGEISEDYFEAELTLTQLQNSDVVLRIINKFNLCANAENLTVAETITMLNNAVEDGEISQADKNSIVALLSYTEGM